MCKSTMEQDLVDIGYDIIGACMAVHSALGPGLLESSYKYALTHELLLRGYEVKLEQPIDVYYKGVKCGDPYKADIIVNGQVLLELKSVKDINEVHFKQLYTYLRLSGIKLGYLVNFNVKSMSNKEGFWRFVNQL